MSPAPARGQAGPAPGPQRGQQGDQVMAFLRGGVVSTLRACFNFLSLNLAMVVVSIPVVTLPLALDAGMVALDRWREGNEERVVREFFHVLRTGPALRTTAAVGAPLVAGALGADEVHYFVRGGSPMAWICLGLGIAGLLAAVMGEAFVLVLWARRPTMSLPGLWSLAIGLGLRRLLVTGPLLLAEFGAATLAGLVDPALVLVGLPLGALWLVRSTARLGLRRAVVGPQRP